MILLFSGDVRLRARVCGHCCGRVDGWGRSFGVRSGGGGDLKGVGDLSCGGFGGEIVVVLCDRLS